MCSSLSRWLKKSFVPSVVRFLCHIGCHCFFLYIFSPEGRECLWNSQTSLLLHRNCYNSQGTPTVRSRLEPATCKRHSGLWPSAGWSYPPLLPIKGSTEQDALDASLENKKIIFSFSPSIHRRTASKPGLLAKTFISLQYTVRQHFC